MSLGKTFLERLRILRKAEAWLFAYMLSNKGNIKAKLGYEILMVTNNFTVLYSLPVLP